MSLPPSADAPYFNAGRKRKPGAEYLEEVLRMGLYRDITDLVKEVVRHELEQSGEDASFLDQ